MLKYTPGPWRQNNLQVVDAEGNLVAHCTRWELANGTDGPRPRTAEANAHVISLTPTLLAAASALVLACDEATWDIRACVPHTEHLLAIADARRAVLNILETLDK